MSAYIGNIPVPEVSPTGGFPLVPGFPHGRAEAPHVVVHQFGSAKAKIEQRFFLGVGALETRASFGWNLSLLGATAFAQGRRGATRSASKRSTGPGSTAWITTR